MGGEDEKTVGEDPVLERSFRGHRGAVLSLAFSPTMKQLASGSSGSNGSNGSVLVWNFKPQMRAFRFEGHSKAVTSVDFSPTGALLASTGEDRSIRLWVPTALEGKSAVIPKAHGARVRSVVFSSDSRLLLTASDDKTLKVWTVAGQKFLYSLLGHSNWVMDGRFSADGRLIASASEDRTLKVWDVAGKKCIKTFDQQPEDAIPTCIRFHPEGNAISAGFSNNAVEIWDVRSDRVVQHYKAHTKPITSVSFHPKGNFLLSSSKDSTLKVYDLREGRLIYTLQGHQGETIATDFSPQGDYFASAGQDEQVLVWKTNFDRHEDATFGNDSGQKQKSPSAPEPARTTLQKPQSRTHKPSKQVPSRTHVKQKHWSKALCPANSNQDAGNENEIEIRSQTVGATEPDGQDNDDQRVAMNLSSEPALGGSVNEVLQQVVRQLDVLTKTVTLVEKRVTATEDRVAQMLRESGKENWQFKDVDGEGPDSSQSSGVREADRAALRDETFSAELERLSEIGDARVDEITDEELQEHIERLEQLQRSYASSKS